MHSDVEQYGLKDVQVISTSYRSGTRDMGKQPESRNAKAAKLPLREVDRVKESSDLGYTTMPPLLKRHTSSHLE
jgi:hypothetical protein